jgi:hypothetical protein
MDHVQQCSAKINNKFRSVGPKIDGSLAFLVSVQGLTSAAPLLLARCVLSGIGVAACSSSHRWPPRRNVCPSRYQRWSRRCCCSPAGRDGEVRFVGEIANDATALDKLLARLARGGRTLRVAYEAGPCGYGVHRHLTAKGIDCVVVAPIRRVTAGTCSPSRGAARRGRPPIWRRRRVSGVALYRREGDGSGGRRTAQIPGSN